MSWLLVACLIAADESGKKPVAKPAAAANANENKPQAPVRLRRSGKDKDGSQSKQPEKPDTATPPKAESTAPPPKQTRKESDLDRQLMKQLGKDLEATEPEEQEAPLLRIGQRMRTVEERLARLDGSEETTTIQKKIIDDLDELLKQAQQQCNSKSQSKSQKQRKPNEAQKSQAKSKPAPAGQPQPKAAQPATQPGRGAAERERFAKVLEDKDVWGHLSDMLRQEMSQYAKEQFLEKYRDLLEQYYSTIAEKSRSGSER